MTRLTSLPIAAKLAILVAATLIGLVTLSVLGAVDARKRIYEERRAATQNVVQVAVGVVAGYGAREASGELSRDAAQTAALAALAELRYSETEYFWVNDMRPYVLMHPIKPELNGTDVSQTKDPDGTRLFVEFAAVVGRDGAGFVEYQWPKPGEDAPQPKISYVAGYEPWGWVVGSGIYVDDVEAAFQRELAALLLQALPIFAVVLVGSLIVVRSITGPIRRATALLETGDISTRLASGAGRNELERLALGLNATLDRVTAVVGDVTDIARQIDRSAQTLSVATDDINEAVRTVEAETVGVATAAGQVSAGMASLAAGTVEVGASISDIAHNATEAAAIAGEAVATAAATTVIVSQLGESSAEIGEFVKVITSIAEQTNLLALNATIEAARAGDAGRGFAVVASEVKELAQETGRASEDIVHRVDSLRADAQRAVQAIDSISSVITRINEYQTSIAGAVQQQEATTADIGRTVSQTAHGGEEIAAAIAGVAQTAVLTSAGVAEIREAMTDLLSTSARLQEAVGVFRAGPVG